MNTPKYTYTKHIESVNLIGEEQHRKFISLQAAYGFAQRGGVKFPFPGELHSKRLISNVNILSPKENIQLIFSESIFSN